MHHSFAVFMIHSISLSRCEVCDCDVRGTEEGAECDVNTGECNCKMFVTGDTCNSCQTGYQLLDAANPFGCSAGTVKFL